MDTPSYLAKTLVNYSTQNGEQTWYKDWAKVIPANEQGEYLVKDVGEWLWKRFIADGLKNYSVLERAYVTAFLAQGFDFGYIVDQTDPDITYTIEQLMAEPLASQISANENATMGLNSDDSTTRIQANRRVGLAINFISMTPFTFAVEGK